MNYDEFNDIISKIEGVNYVKVVAEDDNLKEVHILANNLRSAKQIVRDIESSLIAVFDYRIDRKIISIAQIETDSTIESQRIKYEGVSVDTKANTVECTVKLNFEGQEYSATVTAIKTLANRHRVVAKAVISTIEKILEQSFIFDIQDVVLNSCRNVTFISVIVSMFVNEKEDTMVGSAIVKDDINEAIVRAALDAVNRRIQKSIG